VVKVLIQNSDLIDWLCPFCFIALKIKYICVDFNYCMLIAIGILKIKFVSLYWIDHDRINVYIYRCSKILFINFQERTLGTGLSSAFINE
jgi:hypothetical protein